MVELMSQAVSAARMSQPNDDLDNSFPADLREIVLEAVRSTLRNVESASTSTFTTEYHDVGDRVGRERTFSSYIAVATK